VVAILAHKGAAAFSLGVSFVKANMPKRRAWGLIATFACVTPFGIFIGSALGSILSGENGEIVEGVFDALAAGSFMYIAAVDIITEEFGDAEHSHIPGFAALLAGLGLMTVLAMFV
jgi:solute carrier family 39 (zinc transporter), member 1/2/3